MTDKTTINEVKIVRGESGWVLFFAEDDIYVPAKLHGRTELSEILELARGLLSGQPASANTAPKPDADGWIEWKGGENPAPGSRVEYKCRDGYTSKWDADKLAWSHSVSKTSSGDVIAYRVVSP